MQRVKIGALAARKAIEATLKDMHWYFKGDTTRIYQKLKDQAYESMGLPTGAKLVYHPTDGWLVIGYAYDGSDVKPYLPPTYPKVTQKAQNQPMEMA